MYSRIVVPIQSVGKGPRVLHDTIGVCVYVCVRFRLYFLSVCPRKGNSPPKEKGNRVGWGGSTMHKWKGGYNC